MKRIKLLIKYLVGESCFLQQIFIFLYKFSGKKSWSLGYPVYKSQYIKNVIQKNLCLFQECQLPEGYGSGLDERAVEYPWFFAALKDSEKIILDAGSTLNHYDILTLPQLQKRSLYLMTLAPEGEFKLKSKPMYVYGDLRHTNFADGYFDTIVSISTLEHIGMDNTFLYTNDPAKRENSRFAYLEAVRELKRVLKPGGTLYATMPFGKHENYGWFQVFDGNMVDRLIAEFAPKEVSQTYFRYHDCQWEFADRSACSQGVYFDIHNKKTIHRDYLAASESVVCLQLTK